MERLSITLLGTYQVALDGKVLTTFATDKARALLAYLAVEAGRAHRRETLAALLWADQPEDRARQSLRQTLLYLNQALGNQAVAAPFLLIDRETVQFNLDSSHHLDTSVFAALVAACDAHPHRRRETCLPCLRRLEQAVELYRGAFLEQFFLPDSVPFEEWAVLQREWFHRQALEAMAGLAAYYERRGDGRQARHYAWRQVELEPWREEAHRHLMKLLALDGQRSAALAQYETCRRTLAEELGAEPTAETTALYERIRRPPNPHSRPGDAGIVAARSPCNLPPAPTPFVGRREELAELAEMLSRPDRRLITLVGPGGVGKTRLALQAAADQAGAFAGGVAYVPLSAAGSPALLVTTIVEALRFSFQGRQDPETQLLNYLQDKEVLLVLDALEHLLPSPAGTAPVSIGSEGAVDLLARILRRVPGAVLLATSREPVCLQEEWVYQVDGLPYPGRPSALPSLTEAPQALDEQMDEQVGEQVDEQVERYAAVALFCQRAQQVQRHFRLTEEQLEPVIRICALLEGLPLGIELAAAWTPVHTCQEIAQEIGRSLDFLASGLRNVPERQRSLRATFGHSWALLSSAEQGVFARLSVFRGGFDAAAAREVAGATSRQLTALVAKSLLRRPAAARYDVHEVLRQYAAEQLAADPALCAETQSRHARTFATRLAALAPRFEGAEQLAALEELVPDLENARAAWQWAVEKAAADPVTQCLESLYQYYRVRGLPAEGFALLELAATRWQAEPGQAALWGRIRARQGALAYTLGRYDEARCAGEAALEVSLRQGDVAEQRFSLLRLAQIARVQGQVAQVVSLAEQVLALARQDAAAGDVSRALFLLAELRCRAGETDEAEALYREGLAAAEDTGNLRLIMVCVNALGDLACYRGAYEEAQRAFERCLAMSRELGDRYHSAIHLNNLGTVLHLQGEYAAARSYYEQSLALCRDMGDKAGQAIALSNLGEVAFASGDCDAAGRAYTAGLAIGRALDDAWTTVVCLNNLGEIAAAQGRRREARGYCAEALQLAAEAEIWTLAARATMSAAGLLAGEGREGQAAALSALLVDHPAAEQDVREKAARLLERLDGSPPQTLSSLEAAVDEALSALQD